MADMRPAATITLPPQRVPRRVAWGFVDQGLSSVSNFAITLLAARLLGPSGLGMVVIGFATYLLALSFQRTLIAQPLVISSTSLGTADRSYAARASVTATLALGVAATVLLAGIGLALGGAPGRGLVLVAPWMVAALLQDHWRTILFREERGFAAASNDAAWVVAMAIAVPVAWELRTGWAVVGCWGFGAAVAAVVGLAQTRLAPAPLETSWRWWHREAWPLGKWLAGEGVVYMAGSQATLFALVGILGTAAIGGLRAATTIFGPLTLLRPAVALPGLPAVTRAQATSPSRATLLAMKLSGSLLALTLLYVLALAALRSQVLSVVFGGAFGRYGNLLLPIGTEQTAGALVIGFSLLLKVRRRGGPVLWSQAIGQGITLTLASALALRYGLVGAAWGMAGGAMAETLANVCFSLSRSNPPVLASAPGVGVREPERREAPPCRD
jgi:O-antigen/teichoic acid export membrane protein